jgi:hypothetical protein
MTRKDTLATIKALGCTARFSEGEYRVSIAPTVLAYDLKLDGKAAMAKNEAIAYYTNDSEDAINTAIEMRKRHNSIASGLESN